MNDDEAVVLYDSTSMTNCTDHKSETRVSRRKSLNQDIDRKSILVSETIMVKNKVQNGMPTEAMSELNM